MRALRDESAKVDRLQRRARERGPSPVLYACMRALLAPAFRLWFRPRITGAEHIPREGPAIVAPNHKSFLDAFFIAIATRRHVRFMAKVELFGGPLGWLFVRLGAFPVRRGEADVEALRTARLILEQGGLLVIFPEGTRVEDRDALGSPHHGVGRLALEMSVPIVPAAIAGTGRLWLGPIAKPQRVQLSFLEPIDAGELVGEPDALTRLVDELVWPAVAREYGNQIARPGLVLTALAAIGIGAGLAARRRASTQTRLLGVMGPGSARRREARRRRTHRLRGLFRHGG